MKKIIFFVIFLVFASIFNSCTKETGPAPETEEPAKQTKEEEKTEPGKKEEETVPGNIKDINGISVDLYELKSDPDKSAMRVSGTDQEAGGLFFATAPIESMEFCCPTWTSPTGAVTISLYKWDTDYETTKKSAPAASQRYVDFPDNAWLKLECGAEPGQYLFLLTEGENTVGIWKSNSKNEKVIPFYEGIYTQGAYMVRLNYKYTPEEILGTPSGGLDLSVPAVVPEAYILPNDHPINTLGIYPDTYYAIDGLGRELPDIFSAGEKRGDRFVGLFYWTWHYASVGRTPFNVSETMRKNPDLEKNDYTDPRWQPDGSAAYQNFWNEPVFGYYDSRDEWVLRKHAEMLADAGVDVVIFDNTNGTMTWRPSYIKLLEVFAKARLDGIRTPQVAFLLPFGPSEDAGTQLSQLYLDIYRPGKYQDLWFYWKGKPLIMAYPNSTIKDRGLADEIRDFFQFRPGQPLYYNGAAEVVSKGKHPTWDWLSIYPQRLANNGEQMAVGTAQNWTYNFSTKKADGTPGGSHPQGGLTAMNADNVLGRTYTRLQENFDNNAETTDPALLHSYDTRENAVLYGANFAQQFEYAISKDPEFIFITGWNEWVAGRYDYWPPHSPDPRSVFTVDNAFPDQYSDEFSRDIEPSAGPLGDNYYYQMVSYIRQYKGIRGNLPEPTKKTIEMDIISWDSVTTLYRAYKNNTLPRSHGGYEGYFYENRTGRNDITLLKAAHDDDYIYFMAECADDISPKTDRAWMRLLLNIEGQNGASWEGFGYIVNRGSPGEKAVLEKSAGGWNWEFCADIEYKTEGKILQMAIPKRALGIDGGDFTVRFKWNDNMQNDGDIMDFYNNGDTAPGGRFCYVYKSGGK